MGTHATTRTNNASGDGIDYASMHEDMMEYVFVLLVAPILLLLNQVGTCLHILLKGKLSEFNWMSQE